MPRPERRSTYSGLAEIWIHGEKLADVVVHLNGWVDVSEIHTFGETTFMDGRTSWGGTVVDGLLMSQLTKAYTHGPVELRFPDGTVAEAVVEMDTSVRGSGRTPF